MSAEQYTHIEQDSDIPQGVDDLPTYDDLAQQNGPNSRFGRWRGWIEKRAAERYVDVTPEERARRRERGWGNTDHAESAPRQTPLQVVNQPPTPDVFDAPLHIQTSSLTMKESPPNSRDDTSTLSGPLPFISQPVAPTHLKINHFGSRFLPHTTSQIRCVLPLLADRVLLIGHDNGLSVLDMFPQEWTEHGGIAVKGPDEAQCLPVWLGEGVHQMSILEVEDNGNGTPQGVVLAVVGPSQDSPSAFGKDPEQLRTARMYNLGSLVSLARWTIAQKGTKPVELVPRAPTWQSPPTPSKRHRPQGSIARSIKSLIDSPPPAAQPEPASSYHTFLSPTSATGPSLARPTTPERRSAPLRQNSDESSGWDIVEDLPMRWATDFVHLAAPGSRLAGASVITFATWSDEGRKGKGAGGQLLAIATKCNVLLYETPKGERAYRFAKEFYTPLQPRSLAFIQQTVSDVGRSSTDASPRRFHSHKRSDSEGTLRGVVNSATSSTPLSYGTHLSLFVVFDKKAGWIRLADSAVGEVELADDGGPPPSSGLSYNNTFSSTMSTPSLRSRARLSFDIRENAAKWIVPVRCELPVLNQPGTMRPVHILTRGKRTHIVPAPFPTRSPPTPPLHAMYWKSQPKFVSARVIYSGYDDINEPPLLQLVAFNEHGIEVQESTLTFLSSKGKGRALPDDLVRAEEDLGGDAGFLTVGGNWDQLEHFYGPNSLATSTSGHSLESMDSMDILMQMKREEGMYGWCRKGLEDWRVFWVGGDRSDQGIENAY